MAETPKSNAPQEAPQEQISRGFSDLWIGIKNFFHELSDLREGLDKVGMIKRIKENKRMRGANAWLLMCSIVIASLGLDLNSPAVIIGAMLISPLMAPILGVGLAVGINDRYTLNISLQHFGIAIAIALVTSTLYFLLTPFGDATPEILARTKPTLLDVLVALFGGVAGIISTSRKDQSNAVPGVAIATALMPPLCVTGFGIANLLTVGSSGTLNYWIITSNSFYLFFLNATFVAIATYLIVRLLNLPFKEFENERNKAKSQVAMFTVALLMILPSAYILYGVLGDIGQERRIEQFVKNNFANAICETTKTVKNDSFEVKIFLFDGLEEKEKMTYTNELREKYSVPNAKLNFIQTDIPDINEIEESVRGKVMSQLEAQKAIQDERDKKITRLNAQIDSLQSHRLLEKAIEDEARILFPELVDIDFYFADTTQTHDNLPVLLIKWKDKIRIGDKEDRLYRFIKYRTKVDTMEIGKK